MKLDDILRKYELITEKQKKSPSEVKGELAEYISAATAMNFRKASDYSENLNVKKVHRFKDKLNSMTEEERDFVIAMLMLEKNLETGLPSEES